MFCRVVSITLTLCKIKIDGWLCWWQMTVAHLKEKPAGQGSTPSTPSGGSGMRSAAARLLGTGNGSRALSFGSNGSSRAVSGNSRMGGGVGTSTSASGSQGVANSDGKGTYTIFNTADTLFISDLNSPDKVFPFSLAYNQLLPSFPSVAS
jgi:WD repeat-containing protein 20